MARFDTEKIVNRFVEMQGGTPTKINNDVVKYEGVLEVLYNEKMIEERKNPQHKFMLDIINAKIIETKRLLSDAKIRNKIK